VTVLDRGVQDRAEHDVNLVDAVGRERLPVPDLVRAAVLLQVAVVPGDPGCGELVEPDLPELRGDVVADDLPVALDRGVREFQPRDPLVGIDADERHFAGELLVLLALLQSVVGLVGAGEPGAGEPARAELGVLGVLGVFEDVDLESPPLALACRVLLDRARLTRTRAALALLGRADSFARLGLG
jgi:hypothetical protein